jgi:OCT family organic cation transporter-like MFS transporter 4/5
MGTAAKYKFEDILSSIGDQDKWQIMIFLFTWIEGCLIGFHHLSSSFLGATMDHWCAIDNLPASWTDDQKKQFSIPYEDGKTTYEKCKSYDVSGWGTINEDFNSALKSRPENYADTTIVCQGYTYNKSEGLDTIVNDWDLVCDRLPLLSSVQGSYMGGVFVGCIVFGWASDKFGRRLTMLIAALIQTVSSIAAAFATNYVIFLIMRFLIAFSVSGVFECGFVLVTEICGPKYRTYFGILTQFPFGIGAALLPIIAYFIRSWKSLQLAISVPCCLLGLYYFFVPESPRWLMAEGRIDEAIKILKDGAKRNGKSLPASDEEIKEMMQAMFEEQEDEKQAEVVHKTTKQKLYEVFKELIILVETPEMRKRTLNIFYSWLIVAMVYYGLSFNSKNLGGDRYVNGFISGFVEVPAVVIIIPALAKFGRRLCYCGTFISGGVSCGLVAIATFAMTAEQLKKYEFVTIGFAMLGKFLISMTFAIAYLYTAELFPTKVRNLAVGTASTFARIGSMSAPYIVDLLGAAHAGIPVVIFGIASTSAGLLSLMLPETLNKKLPESVAEIERIGRRKKGKIEGEEMNAIPKEVADSASA